MSENGRDHLVVRKCPLVVGSGADLHGSWRSVPRLTRKGWRIKPLKIANRDDDLVTSVGLLSVHEE